MASLFAAHDTAARLVLAASLLPFLYFAVRDQVLHVTARRVSLAEHVLHVLLGLILTGVIVRAFLFREKAVALGVLAFAAAGSIDEYVFHRGLPAAEHDTHAKEHFALFVFVAVFGVVSRLR
jgi:hypothetical protein